MNAKLIIILLISIVGISEIKSQCCTQPGLICDTFNTESARQMCWFKKFAINKLNISEDTIDAYKTYDFGKDKVYLQGDKTPWGADYFQWDSGGIARRWQAANKVKKITDTSEYKWDHILKMSKEQIALLSPAEKIDIYLGNKSFIITKTEAVKRGVLRANPTHNDGFCNGIRAAGVLTPEPIKSIEVISKEGIHVIFYPADLKALAGASFFHLYPDAYAQLGCSSDLTPNCNPDPGTFDIALRLVLGSKQLAFFIDTSQSSMIYNKTIFGYTRKMLGMASSISTTQEEVMTVDIKTTLYCLSDLKINESNKRTKQIIANKDNIGKLKWFRVYNFEYTLTLDKNRKIKSSKWNSKAPDFVWFGTGDGGDDLPSSSSFNSNPYLPYKIIKELIELSSK